MSDLFEPDVLASLLRQWSRSLRARNRSPRTIETYIDSAQEPAAFARRHGHAELDRALIEDYLADQAKRWEPATVAFRYRSPQQFTKWLTAEDELPAGPMAGMGAPKVPEEPVPVLSRDQLKALLAACKGSGFAERRDTAIIRDCPHPVCGRSRTGVRVALCCVVSSRCTCLGMVRRVAVAYDRSIGRRVMARYLFRRQWGAKTETEMLEGALRSKRIGQDFDDIAWDHSHVVADPDGNVLSYCIYEAPSADLVLDHAAVVGGHFVDQVMDLDADLRAHESVTPLAADDPARRWLVVRSWSDLDRRQIGDAIHRAARTAHDITWEHTHIGSDEEGQLRTHGVYRATDDATIRRFAEEPSAAEVTDFYEIAGDVRPEDLEDV